VHSEYKIPGGKLVVVDFDVVGDVLANVHVSGDFFLEPDDALDAINAALTGLRADTAASALAEAIDRAVPSDVTMLGLTSDGVAVAVRRALSKASTWADYDWQLIHGPAYPEQLQMALDQVLTEEVAAGRRRPTLRFWERSEPAVIIGSFQSVKNEVDLAAAARYGVQLVRRITGGGAMFVEPGSFITYSLYAPIALVNGMSFGDSYAFLDDWVLTALRSVGIDASYKPINDITSPLGKIGGAAQKRLGSGALLHHVTMSYDMDADKMTQVLRIGREKLSDKGTTSAKKRVDPLRSQTGMSREAIMVRMEDTFRGLYGLSASEVSSEELARAERLVNEKFATDEWLYRVP